ncbi:MAG TPA: hypothetical protein GX708_20935 [Gallicola sp.]|nr:hypothetical protein [Gallicola sp.]
MSYLIDNENHIVTKRSGKKQYRYCSFDPHTNYEQPEHYVKIYSNFYIYNYYENPQNILYIRRAVEVLFPEITEGAIKVGTIPNNGRNNDYDNYTVRVMEKLTKEQKAKLKKSKTPTLKVPNLNLEIKADSWKELLNKFLCFLLSEYRELSYEKIINNDDFTVTKQSGKIQFKYCTPDEFKDYEDKEQYSECMGIIHIYNCYDSSEIVDNINLILDAMFAIKDAYLTAQVDKAPKSEKVVITTQDVEDMDGANIDSDFVGDYQEGKPAKMTTSTSLFRDPAFAKKALERDNYLCVIDNNHNTFITKAGNRYVEGHHIIPYTIDNTIKYQEKNIFLDHNNNIISLCPNCHRQIHYGNKEAKEKLVKIIYEKSKDMLNAHNIEIDYETLLKLYLK